MALFATHVVTPDSALGGMVIERSLRFDPDSSAYLNRTPSSAGNRKTMTLSLWVKGMIGGTYQIFDAHQNDSNRSRVFFNDNGSISFFNRVSNSDTNCHTTGFFRDPSSWYHIVFVFDTTQASASNRYKIYINGAEQANDSNVPAQNTDLFFNSTNSHKIGVGGDDQGNENYFDGYMAEINFLDGTAYDASYFGFTSQNGTWLPKKYTGGNYGTNGFYLDFLDNTSATTLGYDKSGNANHFTPNNLSVSAGRANDSFLDTPTNNFPTLNPRSLYHVHSTSSNVAEGNLRYNCTSDNQGQVPATMSMPTSGKWYFEAEVISNANFAMGIVPATWSQNHNSFSNEPGTLGYAAYGSKFENGSEGAGWGAGWDTGNWAAAAVDMDLKQVTFYANNVSQGTLSFKSGYEDIEYLPLITGGTNSGTVSGYVNFGAQGFKYTPPTGFKALNSRNRAGATGTAAVVNPERFFECLTYTGTTTGSGTQTISDLEFAPDFVWIKSRAIGYSHLLVDTVRGASKGLLSEDTDVEETSNQYGMLTSFGSNGFTMTRGSSDGGKCCENTQTYVAWCWKAGGAAVSNSDGSITSSVSANQEGGFSIVTYAGNGTTGATVGHGLGKVPAWVIIKCRSHTDDWMVYHQGVDSSAPEDYYLKLNLNGASVNSVIMMNDTAPTTSVFSLQDDSASNSSGRTYVAYCWSEIPGFSKFGSYVGDGRSDRFSTFVYTGFRPAWVMIKRTTGAQHWRIFDNKRNPFNDVDLNLTADHPQAEFESSAYNALDFLSNGFKLVGTNADEGTNQNGETYVYMAFAEQPGTTSFDTFPNAR